MAVLSENSKARGGVVATTPTSGELFAAKTDWFGAGSEM